MPSLAGQSRPVPAAERTPSGHRQAAGEAAKWPGLLQRDARPGGPGPGRLQWGEGEREGEGGGGGGEGERGGGGKGREGSGPFWLPFQKNTMGRGPQFLGGFEKGHPGTGCILRAPEKRQSHLTNIFFA